MSDAIAGVRGAARLGLAGAADARGRSPRWRAAPAAGRSRRPARRAGRARRSICATAARASAGWTSRSAIANVDGPIARALAGRDAFDQAGVDAALIALDGTPNKARLGGNATVAVSLAVAHAAAAARRLPLWRYLAGDAPVSLPLPEIQIFGGGAHAGRRIDIQDLMVMPVSATSFAQALEMTAEVYRAAGELMRDAGKLAGVADEGGWWPAFGTNEEALAMLVRAIERAGFVPGDEVAISLDIAASELGRDGRYRLGLERRELDRDALIELLLGWLDRYPIASIEDPLAEDDRDGWIAFTRAAGSRVLQIVGDDYLTTNAARVREAAADAACNAVLIKPNQAGTVTKRRRRSPPASPRASPRSSPRAPANPRTPRSSTSRSAGTPGSSRSARSRARNGWRNGTKRCGSRRRWARRRGSRVGRRSQPPPPS